MKALFSSDPLLWIFLDRARREGPFEYDCARAATLKNAIEALGVPHTEVGALRVNGEPATLQRIVRDGDYVEVETTKSGSDPDLRFVADAHLGGLARFLRMLGFDTLHRNAFSDEEIRRLEAEWNGVFTKLGVIQGQLKSRRKTLAGQSPVSYYLNRIFSRPVTA